MTAIFSVLDFMVLNGMVRNQRERRDGRQTAMGAPARKGRILTLARSANKLPPKAPRRKASGGRKPAEEPPKERQVAEAERSEAPAESPPIVPTAVASSPRASRAQPQAPHIAPFNNCPSPTRPHSMPSAQGIDSFWGAQ